MNDLKKPPNPGEELVDHLKKLNEELDERGQINKVPDRELKEMGATEKYKKETIHKIDKTKKS